MPRRELHAKTVGAGLRPAQGGFETRPYASKGFSLIELMVAIAILSIGMAAVGAALYASYESSRFNAGARRAEAAAAQLVERFKAGNIGTASTTPDPCSCKLNTTGKATFDSRYDSTTKRYRNCWNPDLIDGTYFCEWKVTNPWPAAPATPSGYQRLEATVYWDGKDCDRDNLTKCRRKLRILNYFRQN